MKSSCNINVERSVRKRIASTFCLFIRQHTTLQLPQTYALSVTYGDWGKIQQYGLSQTDLASNVATGQTRTYSYGSLNEGQTAFAPNNISYADGTNVNEQYGIGGSLLRRETTAPGNQPNDFCKKSVARWAEQ